MQDSDENINPFTIESEFLLGKYQKKITSLQESIEKLENKNIGIRNNISRQEIDKNNLNIISEKLDIELSEKRKYFAQITILRSFLGLLLAHMKINSRKIQNVSISLHLSLNKFLVEKNKKTLQNNQGEIVRLKNEISFIISQRQKGLELYKKEWLSLGEIRAKKEAEIGLSDNFKSMSDRDFEFFIAELFKEMGYEIEEITPQSADYGVDIVVKKDQEKVAIQCKKFDEKNRVSNRSVAELIGAAHYYGAKRSIFITTSDYTKNARKQATNSRIELWDKDSLHGYVQKYLFKKDVPEIFDAIKNAQIKEQEKKQKLKNKWEERKDRERAKRICPECGGGKSKNSKMCSKCKNAFRRIRKRGGGSGGAEPKWNRPYSEPNWNPFDR